MDCLEIPSIWASSSTFFSSSFNPASILSDTAEELKKMYRKLAHTYQPDNDGDAEEMVTVNNEYSELFERLKNIHINSEVGRYTLFSQKVNYHNPQLLVNPLQSLAWF
jgi:hypothetical protein